MGGEQVKHVRPRIGDVDRVPRRLRTLLRLFRKAPGDRGDGARMSYVRMFDAPDGLGVQFIDFQRALGNSCASGDNFVAKSIAAGLSRSEVHRIRIEMEFVDGPANDVVRVYVNGVLEVTGTSWEDYFRDCEGNRVGLWSPV